MPWSVPTCPSTPPPGSRTRPDWSTGSAAWLPGSLQIGSGRTLGHGLVRVRWTGKTTTPARKRSPAKKS